MITNPIRKTEEQTPWSINNIIYIKPIKHLMLRSIMILSLIFCPYFYSQVFDFRRTEFGITGGINYSKIRHAHNPSAARTSFLLGAYTQIPVSNNCCFKENQNSYINIQLEYNQLGEKGSKKTLYADNYLSLLLMYRFTFKYNRYNNIFFNIGPKFSAIVHQNVKYAPFYRPYEINEDGKANPFDIAMACIGGFSVNDKKTDLYLRGDYSFSNRFPSLNEFPTTGDPLAAKRKIQYSISLGVNYLIF